MDKYIKPPRSIGFAGTALLPLNGMIGAGIFALPALLYAAVGNFAPWMILIGGLACFPLVFVFATLARRFEGNGGSMLYGEAAFGPFVGFQAGWTRYASSLTSIAANSHVMVSYLSAIWPVLDEPVARLVTVSLFILAFTLINLFGVGKAIGALGGMTAVKLLPLVALVAAGLFAGSPAIGITLPQFGDFESVVLLTFYAFMGFEIASTPAGEMKNPKRDLPRAFIGTLALVTLFYMLVIWAYIAIDPGNSSSSLPLAAAAETILGQVGSLIIVIAAVFSIGSNTLNGFINMPRMTYGMAEKGLLPGWFMHVSKRFQTPSFSILFMGGGAMLFASTGGFVTLAVAGTLSRLITYLICAAAVPVLQARDRADGTGRIVPFETIMAVAAFAFSLWIASHADMRAFVTLAGLLVAGTVLYFVARRGARVEKVAAS